MKKVHGSSRRTVVSRRAFGKGVLAAGLAAVLDPFRLSARADSRQGREVDYIVIGAGAGGGPVAARLAEAGFTVALLEAGVDPLGEEARRVDPNTGILYHVPAFAAGAAEHPMLSWDFYVKHYGDPAQQARDSKFVPGKGILYPRGSALGGSSAHNVMIFVYPHDADWDDIADATGDPSWRAGKMRRYFERLEACNYCQPHAPGHGFHGYMSSDELDPKVFELSPMLRDLAQAGRVLPSSFFHGNTGLDVNHPAVAAGDFGAFNTAMHVAKNVRVSMREHLEATQLAHPDRLFIITGALASKILMDSRRAHGVEFMQGLNLYEADKLYDPSDAPPVHRIFARREVILSAGVFNTPQLLKLSGIGPARELRSKGIDVVADLPGVGENLQDRYEITVNSSLNQDIELLTRCLPFQPGDPCFTAWQTGQWSGSSTPFFGPYANNGVYTFRIAKSSSSLSIPDLVILGSPIPFRGFFPGFSNGALGKDWTWLVLKARNKNHAGNVTLRSTNPRLMPEINFHYFEEGSDRAGDDLRAAVEGIKIARSFSRDPNASKHLASETLPGAAIQTDEQLSSYVRDQAWGHHASCTAKIGPRHDPMAVLDSRFRVRGVKSLRVVDASAFPRVPGFFPVASIFMIGEKAADVIIEDAEDDDHDSDQDHGR